MLTYGTWEFIYPYQDRKVCATEENGMLRIRLEDDRYSVVRATLPVNGIQERWFYRIAVDVTAEGADCHLLVTWVDASGKELVKEHMSADYHTLAPEGAVKAMVEVLVCGKGEGTVLVTSVSVVPEAPYTARPVRVCTIACDMESPNVDAVPFAESMAYQLHLIDQVAKHKPDVVVLTENAYSTLEDKRPATAVRLDGEEVAKLREKARQYNTYISCSMLELDDDGVRHNTAILINRQGELQNFRRKTHLTIGEVEVGMPLNDEPLEVWDTDFGKVGVLVCWEHFFPEAVRVLMLQGMELLLIPTHGFNMSRAVSRAMDNGIYLATSHVWSKDTVIVGPDGKVVDTGDGKGYAFAEIDLNEPKHIFWLSYPANMIPNNVYRGERREALYGRISGK